MGTSTGVSNLHLDKLLSNMAIGYAQENGIAADIMPIVPVDKQSDQYLVYSRADALRAEEDTRAPATAARRITRSVSTDTFFCQNYALAYPVSIEDKANMDAAHLRHLYDGRVQYTTDKLLLNWELRVAEMATNTSNVGSSTGVSTGWTHGNADVIGDINTAIDNVQDLTGQRPNRLVMGLEAYRAMRRSTDIRDLIFGVNNGGGYPSVGQIANIFEVDEILVGRAFQNAANEAQAEDLQKVWLDHVLAYYAPASPSMDAPSWGYSFRWTRAGIPNMQVERHPYDSVRKMELIENGYYQDEKVTGAEYGFLLLAVNSNS